MWPLYIEQGSLLSDSTNANDNFCSKLLPQAYLETNVFPVVTLGCPVLCSFFEKTWTNVCLPSVGHYWQTKGK